MSDHDERPELSPVRAPASPVAQGWRYLNVRQKTVLLCTVGAMVVGGMMVWSAHREAMRERPGRSLPIRQQTAIDQEFTPPRLPVMPVMAAIPPQPMYPALAAVGSSSLPDPNKAARESDILAVSGQTDPNVQRTAVRAAGVDLPIPSDRKSDLADRLTATELKPTRAAELPNPDFLISQGRQIPCIQQTAIDTTFPGFVRATIATPVYSDTGNVILLDAGSRVFGSMERAIVNGLSRQFVLWNRITTPPLYDRNGVPHEYAVTVSSPAADEVGATGLQGDVDRHMWQKLSGAVMLSLLQGSIQMGTAALQSGGSTNLNIGSATGSVDNLPSQLLASQVNIPDVLHRNQGLACMIFVARDLDLGNIYKLRHR